MKYRVVLLAFALLTGFVATAPAVGSDLDTDLDRVKEQIAEIRARIRAAASEKSAVAQELAAAAEELEVAEREVTAAAEELERVSLAIDQRNRELDDVRVDLATQFAKLADVRAQADQARTEAENWALEAYMGGGTAQPSIAFNATAVADVSVGVAYLEVLTGHSAGAADRLEVLVAEEAEREAAIRSIEDGIEEEIAELQTLGIRLGKLRSDLYERRGELAKAVADQEALLADVQERIDEFEGELTALAREERSIQQAIEAASAPAPTVDTGTTANSGGWVRPIPGAVTSGFGMRVHPITGQNRMHNGWDMDAPHGAPIKAAKAGRVILSGVKGGYGNTVMIDHGGGFVTLYAHQSKLGVSVGETVGAGEVIGYIGSTGQSTGPHLHFEIRVNGSPVNPGTYL